SRGRSARAARALRRRHAHPDGGLRRVVQPAGRGGDPRRRAPAPKRRAAMRGESDSLNMLPLYFSTRRMARVLGILFVLAAAIGWIAAGYDLGELRAIHRGAELGPGALLAPHPARRPVR